MDRINIDDLPAEVIRFFEELKLPPEGLIVGLDGRPLAWLLPVDVDSLDA